MKIHFIGVGGIGVSALAQYYLLKGHKVSGSDLVSSEITDDLKNKGAKIFIGRHKKENLPKNVDLVIYSIAIPKNNMEFKKAKKLQVSGYKLQVLSYPQALGELTKKYFTIAVSGTHGKSTTTAILSLILIKAGLNPTVILGTKLKEFGNTNFRLGGILSSKFQTSGSKILVIEACEHEESFLNYSPDIAVITNIEADHLDYFKNLNNVRKAFEKFGKRLKNNGVLITEKEYKNTEDAKKLKKILKVPGEHNVSNALAALFVARILKIPDKISFKIFSEYKGSWRRFEERELKIGNLKLKIISDYAHHPTEINATLRAVCEKWPKKEIWAVFQPHQEQRTFYFFNNFVEVLSGAKIDKLIITDIFEVAGRENKILKRKKNSEKMVEQISQRATSKQQTIYIPNIREVEKYLKKNLKGGEIVIIMGAGDIYKINKNLNVSSV